MPQVFVEEKSILGRGGLIYFHSYLVYRADDGREWTIRGGPTGRFFDLFGGAFVFQINVSLAQSDDDRGALTPTARHSRLLFDGATADEAWNVMVHYAQTLQNAGLPYHAAGQNSNTLVAALIFASGLDPAVSLPTGVLINTLVGWSDYHFITDAFLIPADGVLRGTAGANSLLGIQTAETILGFGGSDSVHGGEGADRIEGGLGNDILLGGAGDDIILGGGDDDQLDGGTGADFLSGGDGDDLIRASFGDTVDGGRGRDRAVVDFSASTQAVHTVLGAGSATFADDFNRADGPVGNGWHDMVSAGTVGTLALYDGALVTTRTNVPVDGQSGIYREIDMTGSVTLSADLTHTNGFGGLLYRYSPTILFGNDGNLNAGIGINISRGDQNYSDSRVELLINGVFYESIFSPFQFTESLHLELTYHPDGSLEGSLSDAGHLFEFEFAARTISLPGTAVAIQEGLPDARASATFSPTFDNLTISYGGASVVTQVTDGTNATALANIEDLTLLGGRAADTLVAANGDDVLRGGRGNDTLTGGDGHDVFVLERGGGLDTVTDFTPGVDRIDVSAFGRYALSQQGADTLVRFGGGNDFIRLLGVQASSLSASDFIVTPSAPSSRLAGPADMSASNALQRYLPAANGLARDLDGHIVFDGHHLEPPILSGPPEDWLL